jgi:hypothetical protein
VCRDNFIASSIGISDFTVSRFADKLIAISITFVLDVRLKIEGQAMSLTIFFAVVWTAYLKISD